MSFPMLDLHCFLEHQGPGFLVENNPQKQLRPFGIYLDPQGNINPAITEKTKKFKTDQNRRARNVISSRKYRAKKREQIRQLERDNQNLQVIIDDSEKELEQLNQAFRMFIQHAEICQKCCHVQLNFAE